MKRKLLLLMLVPLIGTFNLMADVSQSFPIAEQTDSFSVRFTTVPSTEAMNAAVGLGPAELSGWGDFNCILSFADDGFLKVRNGSSYEADTSISYTAGRRYYVQMDVNVIEKKYSVKVWPYGGTDVADLATDYSFREDNYTGSINYFSTRIVPEDPMIYVGVSDFQIAEMENASNTSFSQSIDQIVGDFFVRFFATPSQDSIDGGVGMSKVPVSGWSDLNPIISFQSDGKIRVRNVDTYTADQEVSYIGGETYMFFVTGNTVTQTYDVIVRTPRGDSALLASGYGFRDNKPGDTLNYLAVNMNYNPDWGGKPGSYVAVDGFGQGVLNWDATNPVTNHPIAVETGVFSKSIVVTPSDDSIDVAVSLNDGPATAWGDMNAIISFQTSGLIKVRNGDSYTADIEYPYQGGVSYYITYEVDVPNDTYSVLVKKSPQGGTDTLATDYTFRSAPVTEINYLTTKAVWPEEGGDYLKISDVGITLDLNTEPFSNSAPTIAQVNDLKMYADDDAKTIELINISDGDGGIQTLTVESASSDDGVATLSLDYTSGSTGSLTITPVAAGTTTISVTLTDDGGTENEGENETVMTFEVVVDPVSDVRDFMITTADGEYGADNRVLGGKDCDVCYDQWMQSNTGQAQVKNENIIVNIPPKYTYAFYMRFDLGKLPEAGAATAADFTFFSDTPVEKNRDFDSIALYVLEDYYFPGKDYQGYIDQELDEFYIEGDKGSWYDIWDEEAGDYKEGNENWIVADNAPGFEEGNEADLNESWDYINHDVLHSIGEKHVFPAGDSALTISHEDILNAINEDENGVVVFVLTMLPNPDASFGQQAISVYTGEDYGKEPRLDLTWDKNAGGNSVEYTPLSGNIKLYPNPASDMLTVANLEGVSHIVIRNFVGQKVKILNNVTSNRYKFDISDLNNGAYLIDFKNSQNNTIKTSKFIILK